MTTIGEIAKKAKVSKATVSIYLNKRPLAEKLSPTTRERIDKTIKELDYRPSFTARALTMKETKTLGLVIGDIENPSFSHIAAEALDEADNAGYQILLSITKWDSKKEIKALENLMQRQVDGIIYHPLVQKTAKIFSQLKKEDYPLLPLSQNSRNFPFVCNDYSKGMEAAVKHLLNMGHKKITLLTYEPDNMEIQKTFQATCKKLSTSNESLIYANPTEREKMIQQICNNKSTALILIGNRLNKEFPLEASKRQDYAPDIISDFEFRQPVFKNDLIKGLLLTKTGELARQAVRILLERLNSNTPMQSIKQPVEFFKR
jgi:DNA-binding LacI/PurR family transcriptional regulator